MDVLIVGRRLASPGLPTFAGFTRARESAGRTLLPWRTRKDKGPVRPRRRKTDFLIGPLRRSFRKFGTRVGTLGKGARFSPFRSKAPQSAALQRGEACAGATKTPLLGFEGGYRRPLWSAAVPAAFSPLRRGALRRVRRVAFSIPRRLRRYRRRGGKSPAWESGSGALPGWRRLRADPFCSRRSARGAR